MKLLINEEDVVAEGDREEGEGTPGGAGLVGEAFMMANLGTLCLHCSEHLLLLASTVRVLSELSPLSSLHAGMWYGYLTYNEAEYAAIKSKKAAEAAALAKATPKKRK